MADDIENPDAPAGKSHKYARVERERRFLLAAMPVGPVVRTVRIADRYLTGTRLRLRQMVETDGDRTTTVYKLTQKVPSAAGRPGLITTAYLDAAEYEVFARLAARQLRKTRYSIPPFGVDVFEPPLQGLTLAEREFSSAEEMDAFVPPPFIVAEVTDDIRFTGGRLVASTREELAQTLASYGVRLG